MLLMNSWLREWHDDKEIWEHDLYICNMVYEAFDIFNEAHQALLMLQQEEEIREWKDEEETKLKLAQMQVVEAKEPPRRNFSSSKHSSPPQIPISSYLDSHPTLHIPLHVDDCESPHNYCPFFIVDEVVDMPSLTLETTQERIPIEEHVLQQGVREEKNNEVVPILEEQKFSFEALVELGGLLQKEEK